VSRLFRLSPCLLLSCVGFLAAQEISIIPQPASVAIREGAFHLRPDTVISTVRETRSVGQWLSRSLHPATGYSLKLDTGEAESNSIVLLIDSSLHRLGDEGYSLEVAPNRVAIRAPAAPGVFYGAQSLRQLLSSDIYSAIVRKKQEWTIPCVRIEDYPRFLWRGALIDTARHFMPKDFLLKFIDLLAAQKMNMLQLHLTDDQGWRIEIKKYPKLTEVGSVRKETRIGRPRDRKGFDGKPHGGYYSEADVREIIEYASERFVRVVPEIEMPGHAQAALASYPELGNTGERLEVSTDWGVHKNVFNVNEKTILFLQDVLGEVLNLFPSEFIHIGGDEVRNDQWRASPQAQARMRELGLQDETELHGYFIRRMNQFLTSRGRRLVGWDEILEGGLAPGAVVMSWRGTKGGIAAAKARHDVIMTPTSYTYFDYYQSNDPEEPLAIGGFIPLEKVYEFDPVPRELSEEEAKRVLGTQGQLWTEYIATPGYLEYMAFPRLTALAEVAWTPREKKDYSEFLQRLRIQEQRWRLLGVNFRPGKVTPRIVVHGHRGARAVLPENTLPAFQYAIRAGADVLELDVAVTKDNVLVVSHDQRLNPDICRAPGGSPVIRELTLEELRRWDCGALKNPQFPKQQPVPGARVPTLDEVLALANEGSFSFNIEPKSFPNRPQFTPPPDEFAKLLLAAIRRHGLESRVIVQSSDLRILKEMKLLAPEIRLAAICTRWPTEFVAKARAVGAPIVALNSRLVTPESVGEAHNAGLKVISWTTNEPEEWDRLIESGVDAIGTDDPDALIEYLRKRGLR
jgi:hexosaminidase